MMSYLSPDWPSSVHPPGSEEFEASPDLLAQVLRRDDTDSQVRWPEGGRMGGDVASLAAEMTPYVSAAVGAYGGAVLARVRDEAADATVGLGRRLLQRVFGSRGEAEPLPDPLAALAADPGDDDSLAAVRLAIRQALAQDPALQAEVRAMLVGAPGVTQQVRAGRDAYTAGRDQTVRVDNRRPGE